MDRKMSLTLTGVIANAIAAYAPKVDYSGEDISFSSAEIRKLRALGLSEADRETVYVIEKYLSGLGVLDAADGDYLKAVLSAAKRFDAAAFRADPYLSAVKVPETKLGNHTLMNAWYDRGEIFQYDMPDLTADIIVPKLGFFTEKVYFPSVYEGVVPWVSVCPSETNSMSEQIEAAHGRVLVLGLGLGYYPFMISLKENVSSAVIVERDSDMISLFTKHLLPQFPGKDKLTVVQADAFDYMDGVRRGEYDFVFADIWENQFDGAPAYLKIRRHETRLPGTEFTYWIEKEIKACLEGII